MSAIPLPAATPQPSAPRWRWLPAPGTWKYHALLLALGIFVLGPLGGVTAAYMNFSIGFFVGGQVLAGLLGSTVTYGYGADGKHGANYIQTAAASVAGMSAMGVLIQAMVWLGLPQPPMWQLVLYMLTIGMFGAGIGMLYTPILVDRMKLMFPSGPRGREHPARADRPGAAAPLGRAARRRRRERAGRRHRRGEDRAARRDRALDLDVRRRHGRRRAHRPRRGHRRRARHPAQAVLRLDRLAARRATRRARSCS